MKGRIFRSVAVALFALASQMAHAGTVTYVYTDPQGTPLAEANVSGTIIATFDYKPYGSQVLGSPKAGPGYTGHVNDPDTGFVYMQARYYDPVVGRFLSVDPDVPSPGNRFSFNRFAYANDNPAVFDDPSGMKAGAPFISAAECEIYHCENSGASGGDASSEEGNASRDVQLDASKSDSAPDKTIVEIRYKALGTIEGREYNHAFVVVTAPDGQQAYIRGGPTGDGGAGALVSDFSEANGKAFGNLGVNWGPYVPGTVDWTTHPTAVLRVLATGESPGSVMNKLINFGVRVNQTHLNYHPLSVNSNAFAHQAVTVLGVSRPEAKVWAPGSSTPLTVLSGGP